MEQRTTLLKGILFGSPFMASVDCQCVRTNKEKAVQVVGQGEVALKGYHGYLFETEKLPPEMKWIEQEDVSYVLGVRACKTLLDYDVIEVNTQGIIRVRYRADSNDNIIFITNNCNSNCIMCPDSEGVRKKECHINVEYLNDYINLIPDDTYHLTITGGEPTLLKEDLIRLIACCKARFKNTSFLMLTNGRTLSNRLYANKLIAVKPERFKVAIPVYSYESQHHDAVTQVKGSFHQAINGISNIMYHTEVEVRIVIMKNNYKELPNIAKMIAQKLKYIKNVNFMGIELLGNAAVNREKVWVDYEQTAPYLQIAAYILLAAGIEPRIYNYPLCALPEQLWSIAVKSITDYKVRYKEECYNCAAKEQCGGFFFSTIHYNRIKINPIVRNK